VPKLLEDKQIEDSLLLANRDKSLGDSSQAINSSNVKIVEQPLVSNPYLNMVPVKQNSMISPKQVYVARIQKDAIKDPRFSEALESLFEMGFVDYDINLALLKKYCG